MLVSAVSQANADRSTRLLKERVQWVFRQLPKALSGDEEAIHQMRVAGRRLRVALPLLARKPEGRRVRRSLKRLRQLTRAAGASRDLDVTVGLFQARLRELGLVGPEPSLLRRRLREARARSRSRMAEALLDLDIAALRRDLRAAVSRQGEGLFAVLLRLRQARDLGGEDVLFRLETLGERFDPDDLHLVRRRARRLRYVAEVGAALKEQETDAPVLLKELQERLGRVHDAYVLAGWLGGQAAKADLEGRMELAAEARRHEVFFLELARGHHREFLERGPAAVVKQALAAMGQARTAA